MHSVDGADRGDSCVVRYLPSFGERWVSCSGGPIKLETTPVVLDLYGTIPSGNKVINGYVILFSSGPAGEQVSADTIDIGSNSCPENTQYGVIVSNNRVTPVYVGRLSGEVYVDERLPGSKKVYEEDILGVVDQMLKELT